MSNLMEHNNNGTWLAASWIGTYATAAISPSLIVSAIPLFLSSLASLAVLYKTYLEIKSKQKQNRNKKESQ